MEIVGSMVRQLLNKPEYISTAIFMFSKSFGNTSEIGLLKQ